MYAFAQEFKTIVSYSNAGSDFYSIAYLPDSSFITLHNKYYLSQVSGAFDSVVSMLARHKPNGDLIYKRSLPKALDFYYFNVNCLSSFNNKLYVGARISDSSGNMSRAVLIKLDYCLNIEKFVQFHPGFNRASEIKGIYMYSDSEVLINGANLIDSDTLYKSLILLDSNFNIKWTSTYMGDNDEIVFQNGEIHIWGNGYFPSMRDNSQVERKLYYYKFNNKGLPTYRFVEFEHLDFKYGGGSKITGIKGSNSLIGAVFSNDQGEIINRVTKINGDGSFAKSVNLSPNLKNEYATGLCQMSYNRFLIITSHSIDFYHEPAYGYLIDSNLNVIKKKRLLPEWDIAFLMNPVCKNGFAYFYGYVSDSGTNSSAFYGAIDSNLNFIQKPSVVNFIDNLCQTPNYDDVIPINNRDTIWINDLNLRRNMKAVGVVKTKRNFHFVLFPNPTSAFLNIESEIDTEFEISDMLGQILKRGAVVKGENKFDLSSIATGNYCIKIGGEFKFFQIFK